MSCKSNQSVNRCIYCNCLSHVASNCNSNMKGRRKILTEIGNNFMLDDALPDFKSFPINELRFIASKYEVSQKIPNKRKMKQHMSDYFDRPCLVEYLYSPIPTTLTKSRMIKDLTSRWRIYTVVRVNYNHEKPENDDCPICMDCMSTPLWNPVRLDWDKISTKTPLPAALFDNNIRTQCGHTFCGGCWEMHIKANSKVEYHENRFHREPTGRMIVACPMCRHQLSYSK